MTADRTDAAGRLAAVARLGPFFAVEFRPDVAGVGPDQGWRTLGELGTPTVLRERVAAARARIAGRSGRPIVDIEERATASILFLGWAARLLSPALGAAAIGAEVPRMASARWRPSASSPMPLALPDPILEPGADAQELAGLIARVVLDAAIEPLAVAVAETFALSDRVIWGNVASALAGAAKLIADAQPELAAITDAVVDALLATGELRHQGAFTGDFTAGRTGPRVFTRTTCCLFYRIPGAGTCGDCVLNSR